MKVKTLMIAVLAVGVATYLVARSQKPVDELHAIQRQWRSLRSDYWDVLRRAKSPEERRRLEIEAAPNVEPFALQCLELARTEANSALGLAALWWAASNAPDCDPGKKTLAILHSGRLDRADLNEIMYSIERDRLTDGPRKSPFASYVLERVKRQLDHPQAAHLITWVCTNDFFERGPRESATFAEAADLIVANFAMSQGIQNFCECLAPIDRSSPPWAGRYERHLRTILEKNSDRFVRCSALFALASVVESTGEPRRDEAALLYQQFIDHFQEHTHPGTRNIEEMYVDRARKDLAKIKALAIGEPAPEIEGADVGGQAMKLSEFRGRVVLLSFWETTDPSTVNLITQQRSLLERFRSQPFSIVGVNGDLEARPASTASDTTDMTWRSFQNQRAGKMTISNEWKLFTWPTLFLIDHRGIIRRRWDGSPPAEILSREIEQLFAERNRAIESPAPGR